MFSYITGESNKIGFGMLPGVADFPSAHLKRRCLIVNRYNSVIISFVTTSSRSLTANKCCSNDWPYFDLGLVTAISILSLPIWKKNPWNPVSFIPRLTTRADPLIEKKNSPSKSYPSVHSVSRHVMSKNATVCLTARSTVGLRPISL